MNFANELVTAEMLRRFMLIAEKRYPVPSGDIVLLTTTSSPAYASMVLRKMNSPDISMQCMARDEDEAVMHCYVLRSIKFITNDIM